MSKYATPGAFRTAVSDKLHTLSEKSQWTLPQLRRQFAYDRFLERLYLMDDDSHRRQGGRDVRRVRLGKAAVESLPRPR